MKTILYFINFSLFLISCDTVNLSNSRWDYKINEESISFIEFTNDSLYIEYDSEVGEYLYGNYTIDKNQIILNQTDGEFDSEFSDGSRHKTKKESYFMVIKNKNQLGYIDKWKSGHWENEYFFQRVKIIESRSPKNE